MDHNSEIAQQFLSSPDVKTYEPMSYLIEPAEETGIQNIYKNLDSSHSFDPSKRTIIDIFGPSGVGKDTVTRLDDPTIADIRIATSRQQRDGEADSAYVWMRGKKDTETEDDYFKSLAEEYGLVSYAVENGILYGVPHTGLDAVKDLPITTVRMSARSIDMLRENVGDQYNIVSLMVVPDSFDTLVPSILSRGNIDHRFREAIENMKLGKQYANYFLLNKHANGINETKQISINETKKSFSTFVHSLDGLDQKF